MVGNEEERTDIIRLDFCQFPRFDRYVSQRKRYGQRKIHSEKLKKKQRIIEWNG